MFNTRFKKRVPSALLAFIALSFSTSAFAGVKTSLPVVVDTVGNFASGDLNGAFNTADNTQYLGCYTFQNYGMCFARDSAGVNRTCASSDPETIAVIRSLSGDGLLRFEWDAAGKCRGVSVSHFSYVRPKNP